jgi:hypothetical protein
MKKTAYLLIIAALTLVSSCKDETRFVEPNFVLTKWAGAIQNLNYRDYASCEAYPKNEATFRDMYRNYYFMDIMTTEIEDADDKNARTDQGGNRYLHRSLEFEGAIINRQSRRATGVIRGNAVFVKFLDGKRARDGWLISNRTLIPVQR